MKMFDIGIAEITSRWDISGVICLAAIPCLVIVMLVYSKGFIAGTSTCLILFVVFAMCTGDSQSNGELGYTTEPGFLTNKSQTKWIRQNEYSINDRNCIFFYTNTHNSSSLDDVAHFIPTEEMYVDEDGWYRMKSTGKRPTDDDYYLYDEVVNYANAPTSVGGKGIPQWIYHPAAPIWIFGIGGAPALIGGTFIASKLRD